MFSKLKTFYRARGSEDFKNTLAFAENLRILLYTGFWRHADEERNWLYFLRRGLIWYMSVYNVYVILIGQPLYIYVHSDQYSVVTEGLANQLMSLMACTNCVTIYLQNGTLNHLVQLMRDMFDKHCPMTQETLKITEKTNKLCHFLSDTMPRMTCYLFWLIGVIPLYSLFKERDIDERIKCWYPFDPRAPVVYGIVVFAFLSNFVLMIVNTLNTDAFIVCMFLQTRAQLKVLQLKMKALKANAELVVADKQQGASQQRPVNHTVNTDYGDIGTHDWDDESFNYEPKFLQEDIKIKKPSILLQNDLEFKKSVDLEMKASLGACVAHHCAILQFIQAFEKFWNPVFSLKIIFNLSVSVLFLASSSVKSWDSTGMVLVTIVLNFYLEISMFSYLAEKVADELSLLKDAVYECDWFEADEGFKKCMRIVMSMANQPTLVRAGGFVPLSMQTVLSVMQTVYSYCTVLQNF